MKTAEATLELAGQTPRRGELLAVLGPAIWQLWLLLAVVGLGAGLAWRWSGAAPTPSALVDGVGAGLWLGALWLAPAWQRLTQRYRGPGAVGARVLGCLLLVGAALMLSLAPLGVLLGYAPDKVIVSANPTDMKFAVTLQWLLLVLLPLCAAPLLLGGTALLVVLRRLAGHRGGTALWLVAGLPLHLPLLAASDLHLPVGAGALVRLALVQFSSTDPIPWSRMLEPLQLPIGLAWVAALVVIGLSLTGRPPRPQAVSPLLLALTGGSAAAALHGVLLALHWSSHAAQLTPDGPLGALGTLLVTTCLLWLVLAPLATPTTLLRDTRRNLPWLGYAGALVLLLDLPQRLGGTSLLWPSLATCVASLLGLLVVVSLCTLLLRSFGAPLAGKVTWGSSGAVLAIGLLLIALVVPNLSGSQPLSLQPGLQLGAAALVPQQQTAALLIGLSLALVAALALYAPLLRRYRPRVKAKPVATALP